MKSSAMPVRDDLDQYGHMYSDELRESVVTHYVQKFLCQGDLAMRSMTEIKSWIAGTAGATTRSEKNAIFEKICSNRRN